MNPALAILFHFGQNNVHFEIKEDNLIWLDDKVDEPTIEELQKWESERVSSLLMVGYAENRKTGTASNKIHYATIEDQFDMQYWDKINGTTTWVDHLTAVKAAHPKVTEPQED